MRGNKLMDTLAFFCSSVPKYKGHLLLQSASGVAYCNHDAQIRREEPHGSGECMPCVCFATPCAETRCNNVTLSLVDTANHPACQ